MGRTRYLNSFYGCLPTMRRRSSRESTECTSSSSSPSTSPAKALDDERPSEGAPIAANAALSSEANASIADQVESDEHDSSSSSLKESQHKEIQQPKTPRKRRVQFSDTSQLYESHVITNNDEDWPSTWYSKRDRAEFYREMKLDVTTARFKIGADHDPLLIDRDLYAENRLLLAGIEHLVCKRTKDDLLRHRADHREAVLEEYWYQTCSGDPDPCEIRAVSRQFSHKTEERALKLAGNVMARRPTPPAA